MQDKNTVHRDGGLLYVVRYLEVNGPLSGMLIVPHVYNDAVVSDARVYYAEKLAQVAGVKLIEKSTPL